MTADRQALLAELRIEYTDGTTETIGTDATWQVSESGPVRMADLYDGETYDATQEISDWHNAAPETLKVTPPSRRTTVPRSRPTRCASPWP